MLKILPFIITAPAVLYFANASTVYIFFRLQTSQLTHWGRLMGIYASVTKALTEADKGLLLSCHQASIWIGPWGTNFGGIWISIQENAFGNVCKTATMFSQPQCVRAYPEAKFKLNCWGYYPGTLSCDCNSFEDQAHLIADEIYYQCPIYMWVVVS